MFAFDAGFSGSLGGMTLPEPVVGLAADPDGMGYVLAGADGGVFAFDAAFSGSLAGAELANPVLSIAADPDGAGYWLSGLDGGVFAFDAPYRGGAVGLTDWPVIGIAAAEVAAG